MKNKRRVAKNSGRWKTDSDILDMLHDPRMMPHLITVLAVGVGLGYAIKIAIDSFKAGKIPPQLPPV